MFSPLPFPDADKKLNFTAIVLILYQKNEPEKIWK